MELRPERWEEALSFNMWREDGTGEGRLGLKGGRRRCVRGLEGDLEVEYEGARSKFSNPVCERVSP